MVAVPSGQVTLSDRRTQSSWPVEVAPFQMSVFPVTQSWYARVTGRRPSSAQGERLPVEGVSWWDAVEFCNALSQWEGLTPAYRLCADAETAEWDASADGYRLPTEAEWEHACRAGTTGPRYGQLDEVAWYQGNSDGGSTPSAASSPTHGACTTCWAMCGTGAGTSTTPRCMGPTGCSVVVDGLTSTGAAARRCGGAVTRPSASTTWDFASCAPHHCLSRSSLIPNRSVERGRLYPRSGDVPSSGECTGPSARRRQDGLW